MGEKTIVLKEKVIGTLNVKLTRQIFLTFNFAVKTTFEI